MEMFHSHGSKQQNTSAIFRLDSRVRSISTIAARRTRSTLACSLGLSTLARSLASGYCCFPHTHARKSAERLVATTMATAVKFSWP